MVFRGFLRSLLFAAAAGGATFLLLVGLAPGVTAFSAFLLSLAVVYVVGLARPGRDALRAGAAAATLAFLCLLLAPDAGSVAIGAALVVGVGRSAVLHQERLARALALEAALLLGGLALARWLAGPSALQVALAVWGFFLVQSCTFLVGGLRERRTGDAGLDPFELAKGRLLRLLEDDAL